MEMNTFQELINDKNCSTSNFFDRLRGILNGKKNKILDIQNVELLDKEFIDEIKCLSKDLSINFGRTLRDLRCSITDDEGLRSHYIFLKYLGSRRIIASAASLPDSPLQDREYSSIEEVVTAYLQYINSLNNYFTELENLDRHFTVIEPVKPTFRDDYRIIVLDRRVWLHIKVTENGFPTNVHLVGHSDECQEKLVHGLLSWNLDIGIAENIISIFDEMNISNNINYVQTDADTSNIVEAPSCTICQCVELADYPKVPQPLCRNDKCGAYYHRACLFQWLVGCGAGRIPTFGAVDGSCPACLQPITCCDKDT